MNRLGASLKAQGYAGATVNKHMTLAALLLGYAVEFDVIAELPLKKKLKKQRANKPCLELNSEERAAFLAAFNNEEGLPSPYGSDRMSFRSLPVDTSRCARASRSPGRIGVPAYRAAKSALDV